MKKYFKNYKVMWLSFVNIIFLKVIPLKQLNLEFRPFETKRKLVTSFDLFLADKCLHEILFSGCKLGKEFRKRRRYIFIIYKLFRISDF